MQNPDASLSTGIEPEAEREVVIERWLDAPARILFLAHGAPQHLRRWFGPRGYPLSHCEMDFRVGGRFRFRMTGPDGVPGPYFGGEYLRIVPDELLEYTNGFEGPGEERMMVTLRFTEDRGRTLLSMRTVFGSIAMKEVHSGQGFVQGVRSGLDQLAAVVRDLWSAPEATR